MVMKSNLPAKIDRAFREHLETIRSQEQVLQEKMTDLLEKEKTLETERIQIDMEKAAFRASLQNKVEAIQKTYAEEIERLSSSLARLENQLALKNEDSEIQNSIQIQKLHELTELKTKLENSFTYKERIQRDKFDQLIEMIDGIHETQEAFDETREKELQRVKQQHELLKKSIKSQTNKAETLRSQTEAFKAWKNEYRNQFRKDYQTKLKELEKDFVNKSAYHARRLKESDSEKELFLKEKEKLVIKEQQLNLDATKRADEVVKKKLEDIENFEKKVKTKEEKLIQIEKALVREKNKLLKKMVADKGANFMLEELKALVDDQTKVVEEREKFAKEFEEIKTDHELQFAEKSQQLEKENEKILALLNKERQYFQDEFKKLKDKEKQLLKRETHEIETLDMEYEELRESLESEKFLKEIELEDMWEKTLEKENDLLERQNKNYEDQLESLKQLQSLETDFKSRFDGFNETLEDLKSRQEHVVQFLDEFQEDYKNRLEAQDSEYESFRGQMERMKNEFAELSQNLKEDNETSRQAKAQAMESFEEELNKRRGLLEHLETDLRGRMEDYGDHLEEMERVKSELGKVAKEREREIQESMSQHENQLMGLSESLEELTENFQKEKDFFQSQVESGRLEMVDVDLLQGNEEERAKREWEMALKSLADDREIISFSEEFLFKFAESWNQKISVPPGTFWMGEKSSGESAPYRELKIEKPFSIRKQPTTNIEFFQFVHETGYRTQAEGDVVSIVFRSGVDSVSAAPGEFRNVYSNPTLEPDPNAFWLYPNGIHETLKDKHRHPVTQITWHDAQAFCQWKTETTGIKHRLPTESEWEYVAKNLGQYQGPDFYWPENKAPEFCNIEETGLWKTVAVDHFPENDFSFGAQDLFGNVYEWTQDGHEKRGSLVSYRTAKGGSFITPFRHIAPWRRLPFAENYAASFLGFRVVIEEG